jgi:hypothetical protein
MYQPKLIRIPGTNFYVRNDRISSVRLKNTLRRDKFSLSILFTDGNVSEYDLPTEKEDVATMMTENFIHDFNNL